MPRPPAPLAQVRDLELLLVAHHPLVFLETVEEERAVFRLEHGADRLNIPYMCWDPVEGLHEPDAPAIPGTTEPIAAPSSPSIAPRAMKPSSVFLNTPTDSASTPVLVSISASRVS